MKLFAIRSEGDPIEAYISVYPRDGWFLGFLITLPSWRVFMFAYSRVTGKFHINTNRI